MGHEPSPIAVIRTSERAEYSRFLGFQLAFVALLATLAVVLTRIEIGNAILPMQAFVAIYTLLEMIAVILAVSACFTIASAAFENKVGWTSLFAAALFATASLNLMHLLTMPALFFEAISQQGNALSLGSRSLMSGALLGLSISSRSSTTTIAQRLVIVSVYAVAICAASAMIVQGHPLAIFSPPGDFKIEWVFTAALAMAAFCFKKTARDDETKCYALMFSAAAILSISELVFAGDVHAPTINRLAPNAFSVVAYWCIYRAIFEIWVRRPFERLTEQAETLRKINSTLRFKALALESAPVSIVLMDAAGQITWQNKASLMMDRRDDASAGIVQVNPPRPSEITPQIRQFLAVAAIWKGGYQKHDANGSLRYFDKSITAVKSRAGLLEGYVSVTDDISDTIKGELRYKRLLETAQDGFTINDIYGNYLEVNDSFARMVGYSRDELLTMNAQALYLGSATSEWLERVSKEAVVEQPRYNAVITKKDGSKLAVQSSVTFAVDDQVFIAFTHDNTLEEQANATQRELENQLLHAQKVQALGALTSGIAHDFNNILASILGYANLALDRSVPDKESKLAKYLNEVVSASERGRDLISKMMTFTRSKRNTSVSDVEPLFAVEELVAMVRPSIPSNIAIKIIKGPPVTVRIDNGELNQMLVNLTINARDAITVHGEITIGWERIDATGRTCAFSRQRLTEEYVCIFVSDSGSGIEGETLKRIFDPYFTTKDVGRGSGLGLSMVQGIMQRAHGHVLVNSELGVGTTFRLLFPITPSITTREQRGIAEAALATKGEGQRIWVIDDEAPICRYMDELLGEWGYDVQTFQDPAHAWARFQIAPIDVDLVVSDQTMNGLTGAELIEKMRGLVPDLPALICSGNVEEVAPGELGKIEVFRKPVDAQAFLRAVALKLSQRTPVADN